MSAPRYALLASRLLSRQLDGRGAAPPSPEARERAIASVERAVEQRIAAGRRVRWLGACAAAAALVVTSAGVSERMTRLRSGHALTSTPTPEPASVRDDLQIVAHPMGSGARVLGSAGETDLSEGWSLGRAVASSLPPRAEPLSRFPRARAFPSGRGRT
jgi:hypothetical protein